MLGGLIAGALTGAAKGAGEVAQMGLDRENKIDLAKAMADIDEQKQLRIDEVTRGRNIEDIGKKAVAEVGAKSLAMDEAGRLGLPEKEVALEKAKFDASKGLERDKAVAASENAAAGQVAKTKLPGYLQSIQQEDIAKSAGERSVANVTANAPKVTALADGTYAVVTGGKITSYLTDPKTGEKVTGPKDLDARTSAMVNALLLDAKTELDPEARKATVEQAISLLRGGPAKTDTTPAPPAGGYLEGDIVNLKDGTRGQVVKDADGTLKVKRISK